ncbi:hypothetical protein HanXRQr2_Chr03g0138241 [Helianthus annuus]|uniref:Uncharacterized protein n=1 Tax=Helianthus annuus TaxID=4232 RepID=A0A9K3JKZ2_HELAN|nr:hypothetical protein HanXRQr2_Chr03g0138241 [Helianthus annuus]KAJ0610062.1 hypothetical protein HanHA89_Chr03g0126671 [Helianthus annuus]KAJ0775843.1 hypothetical protein HanOQP8_Chr03g0127201 [Helianthus annuus]KAJ0819056.1 hypothetical protein HanLR1_Chr00c0279g0735121 [Helianthus annuus]KAJ0946042.1 hypothetical protein HanPSC8_Chr03g0134811 [Helianthus annuus]
MSTPGAAISGCLMGQMTRWRAKSIVIKAFRLRGYSWYIKIQNFIKPPLGKQS